MQDGQTQIVDLGVVCPKCHQESHLHVATGVELETIANPSLRALQQPVDRIPSRSTCKRPD